MQGQMKPEGHLEGDLYDLFPGGFLVFYLTFCSYIHIYLLHNRLYQTLNLSIGMGDVV